MRCNSLWKNVIKKINKSQKTNLHLYWSTYFWFFSILNLPFNKRLNKACRFNSRSAWPFKNFKNLYVTQKIKTKIGRVRLRQSSVCAYDERENRERRVYRGPYTTTREWFIRSERRKRRVRVQRSILVRGQNVYGRYSRFPFLPVFRTSATITTTTIRIYYIPARTEKRGWWGGEGKLRMPSRLPVP